MTRQLTKSRDFCQNYLCDFHLCSLFASFSFLYWFCNSLGWTKKDPPSPLPFTLPFYPPDKEENWGRQVERLPKHDQINFKLNTLTTEWRTVNTDYDFLNGKYFKILSTKKTSEAFFTCVKKQFIEQPTCFSTSGSADSKTNHTIIVKVYTFLDIQ